MLFALFSLILTVNSAHALDQASDFQNMWSKRDLNNTATAAISQLEARAVQAQDDFDLQWNLSRFYYWAASETKDSALAADLSKKGWNAAEAAKLIKPDRIEGWYWATANIGLYAESSGTFVTVKEGLSSHYELNAEKAVQIKPLYDDGGP